MSAVREILPTAWLLLAALLVFAALMFLCAAAWFGRELDTDGGEYRDASGTRFGRFTKDEWTRIRKNYNW